MRKSVIMNWGVAALAMVILCGCQITNHVVCDDELINTTMGNWKEALLAKNLDKLMAAYSGNYVSTRGSDKGSMRELMTKVFERGYLDDAEITLEGAQTAIEGDKATFGPVEFVSDSGTRTMDFTLQNENGTWLIVSSERR